jgi:hypothetical protein
MSTPGSVIVGFNGSCRAMLREVGIYNPLGLFDLIDLTEVTVTACRSSVGKGCRANHFCPLIPVRLPCGHGGIKCVCRIDWIRFLSRTRCRTNCIRRATCRLNARVFTSGIQTSGKKPLA